MLSLSLRLRVVARRKSPATAATSRAGGAMARNCLSLDGKLMAVNVTEGPTFRAGVPESLFQALVVRGRREFLLGVLRWDGAPDGKHFLIDIVKTPSKPLTVVLNWTSELKKK